MSADPSVLGSARVIPAGKDIDSEDRLQSQSEQAKKNSEKFQKVTDPIIDRYNPYQSNPKDPNIPRPPSPTPWLAPNFSVVGGDFQETNKDEVGTQGGLSEDQVKDIIEKVKKEHKKKSEG
jgi:hypothetical protein